MSMLLRDIELEFLKEVAFYTEHLEGVGAEIQRRNISDFRLLCCGIDRLQESQQLMSKLASVMSTFGVITGMSCSGKSYFANSLCQNWPTKFVRFPEVMTRKPRLRLGEIDGTDLIYMPQEEFDQKLIEGKFLLAYEYGEGDLRKSVGILIESFLQAAEDSRNKILIADPYELTFLLRIIPLTRCILVRVDQKTHKELKRRRGVSETYGEWQNETGIRSDDLSYLPMSSLTMAVWNKLSPSETRMNLLRIKRFLRATNLACPYLS